MMSFPKLISLILDCENRYSTFFKTRALEWEEDADKRHTWVGRAADDAGRRQKGYGARS